jgi:hypothetical protein
MMALMRVGVLGAVLVRAGCAAPDPFVAQTPPRGEQLIIRHIPGANPDKQACTEYQAATNSCAAVIASTMDGNTLISSELVALVPPSGTGAQRVEIVSRSALRGPQACLQPEDLTATGRYQTALALLELARGTIEDFGGSLCSSTFRAGDGYVVSTVGANGEAVPPGDVRFQFVSGVAQLRAH